ncbi:MAG TPA: hypothetical protein VEW04_00660 [Allosphingosinicella sp.]|nr:hypothetical protein [Allosphingosinicella sp.]
MRSFILAAVLIAAPAAAQQQPRLGQRTTSPEAMVAQMNRASPEDEMREQIAAAEAHPLGSAQNPIRVAGPDGERAYLARLRCPGGSVPRIGPRGEGGVGAYGSVVSAYELGCGDSISRLLFDIYQEEHVETRAPAGFNYVN